MRPSEPSGSRSRHTTRRAALKTHRRRTTPMKWCRFQAGQDVSYGIVEDERVIEVAGSPFAEYTATRTSHPLTQVRLLPPVIPPMLYAAGPNYRGHVEAMARRRGAAPQCPPRPEPNFRSVHALIGPEDNIVVPKDCAGAVQPEGQLAVVIGKRARNVSKEDALGYVFGYSIGNDISQRDWQRADRTRYCQINRFRGEHRDIEGQSPLDFLLGSHLGRCDLPPDLPSVGHFLAIHSSRK